MHPSKMTGKGLAEHIRNMQETGLWKQVPPQARAVVLEAAKRAEQRDDLLDHANRLLALMDLTEGQIDTTSEHEMLIKIASDFGRVVEQIKGAT
jgi:TRAP-type C4-dicarboxylate transport system substrate-binding protein